MPQGDRVSRIRLHDIENLQQFRALAEPAIKPYDGKDPFGVTGH